MALPAAARVGSTSYAAVLAHGPLVTTARTTIGWFVHHGVEAPASGSGFPIGTGRIRNAVAPLTGGWQLAAGSGSGAVSVVFVMCAVLAGIDVSAAAGVVDSSVADAGAAVT